MTQINTAKSAPMNRAQVGPFDASEAQGSEGYADFGSVLVRPLEGMDLRLEIEEGTQRITAITIAIDDSNLQLQAYAAPKTEGLWHEVRAQLASSVREQGGVCEERVGSFGPELLAQIPEYVNEQQVGRRTVRFIGVDGPRWFLRGVVGGAAVNDPAAASRIESVYREAIVNRGSDPVPPRDLLELRLPAGVVAPPRVGLEA